jgi:hypothetical protein
MSEMQYFLLGMMVAWTPSLILLAWLIRPAFKSEIDLDQIESLDY